MRNTMPDHVFPIKNVTLLNPVIRDKGVVPTTFSSLLLLKNKEINYFLLLFGLNKQINKKVKRKKTFSCLLILSFSHINNLTQIDLCIRFSIPFPIFLVFLFPQNLQALSSLKLPCSFLSPFLVNSLLSDICL